MQNGQPINEVYSQLGFPNYSSFYRAFLKEYGCSPTAYLQERMATAAAETRLPE